MGKFILETQRVVTYRSWEDLDTGLPAVFELEEGDDDRLRKSSGVGSRWSRDLTTSEAEGIDDVIVFDSNDEDECEDIFASTWDAEVVAQRRRSRISALRRK